MLKQRNNKACTLIVEHCNKLWKFYLFLLSIFFISIINFNEWLYDSNSRIHTISPKSISALI